jgi:hypothetical protein
VNIAVFALRGGSSMEDGAICRGCRAIGVDHRARLMLMGARQPRFFSG